MERPVALKVIKKALTDDPGVVERFRREVKAAARLSHPNIVHAYDAEQAGDTHFLVMEYVEGTDLGKRVKERGPLPVREACDYVRQAALGLEHARERGLVHRDVKPQNLMLTPQGVIKILDFGLAQLASAAAGSLTGLGTLMGTPDYIAPEQARDARSADIRADVYSLGCTLYHLLAGRPPFGEGLPLERVVAHLERPPRPLAEVRRELPSGLVAVVERMMAKDPARRYQTPGAVAEALAPFAGLAPPPLPRRRRNLRRWLAAAVLLLAVLGGLGWWFGDAAVRFARDEGELVLEADDRDLDVTIRAGGGAAINFPLERHSQNALRLFPGDYEIEARDRDGRRFGPTSVHLRRGGREVVSAARDLGAAEANEVTITEEGGAFQVRAAKYEATVEADGCVTSLRLGGVEFLAPGVDLSRGGYFFDLVENQVLALPAVGKAAWNAILARGRGTDACYEFGADSLAWTLTNRTDHAVFFYVVLSTKVTAVRSGAGRWARTPAERDWTETTWFAGPERLGIAGSTRIWGPWVQGHQVWEARLEPGQTRTVTLTVGTTTAAEAARAAEVSRRPEPAVPADREPPSVALVTRPPPLKEVRGWTLETRGVRARVEAIAYSPDGSRLATAGHDGAVRLWEPDTGRLVRILVGHRGNIRSLAWSPDSKTLASASWDGTVSLWEADTGRVRHTLKGHTGGVNAVAWAPKSAVLATAGNDHSVRLWDAASGRLRETLSGHRWGVWALAWSPDGQTLASGSVDGMLHLWTAPWTGQAPRSWDVAPAAASHPEEGAPGGIFYLAFSPDGKTLASGSRDQKVRLWGVAGPRLVQTVRGASVAWSADGKTLATGGMTNVVRLWDAASGVLQRTLERHTDHTFAVAFSPDGKELATGGGDCRVLLWQPDTGQVTRALPGGTGRMDRADWSPDGKTLAAGVFSPSRVHFWELGTGRLTGPLAKAFWAVWSPDGQGFGSHCPDGRTRLFRADNLRQPPVVLQGPTPATWELTWSPDGQTVATAGEDRTVRLWQASTGKLLKTLTGHIDKVDGLAWSPDGRLLASAGADFTTRIWDVAAGRRLYALQGAEAAARGPSLAWSPDGQTLAIGNLWGRLTLWDVRTGTLIDSSRKHQGRVSVAWSADGDTLLSAGEDSVVRFWDARDGALRRVVPGAGGFGAFSPDRRFLASPLANTIRVWEIDNGRLRGTLVPLEGAEAMVVSPDGHFDGPPGALRQLLYVVETDRGQDLITPEQFAKKYGWKNDKGRVRLDLRAPAARP
jgi:WD40 repeat protein